MPPTALIAGSTASRRSPVTSSRRISRPTTKKNSDISPSLTRSCASWAKLAYAASHGELAHATATTAATTSTTPPEASASRNRRTNEAVRSARSGTYPAMVMRWLDRGVLAAASRRSQQVVLAAGLTGALTGLAVAAFERLTAEWLLPRVVEADLPVQAVVPGLGLVVAAIALRAARTSPSTADEYIRVFHDTARLPLRPVLPRMFAAIATLGA